MPAPDKNPGEPDALWIGVAGSLVLLVVLGILQHTEAAFLKLPAHWLGVAALPVVVGLVAGGHLKRFKGFGIELEAFEQPVEEVELTVAETVADLPGDEKGGREHLRHLVGGPPLRRLVFHEGRAGYYRASAVRRYLEGLPTVEYLEVRQESGALRGVLPVGEVRGEDGRPDRDSLERFVTALEKRTLLDAFPAARVPRVRGTDSVARVLRELRDASAELGVVADRQGRDLGVVVRRDLERRVVESVLEADARR